VRPYNINIFIMNIFSIFTDPFMDRRRVAVFGVIAVLVWVSTVMLLLQESRAGHRRVILIVIDGLRSDAIDKNHWMQLPAFSYLIHQGASTLNARSDVHDTKALPNNVSIITGRPVYDTDSAHRYVLNSYTGQAIHDIRNKYIHSFFDVLYSNNYRNAFFASKHWMGLFIKSYTAPRPPGSIFNRKKNPSRFQSFVVTEKDDAKTFEAFMIELTNFDARCIFLHFSGVEAAGRASGWDVSSPESPYMKAVAQVDGYLGEILETVQKRRHLRGNVFLIVTSSHGGSPNPDAFQVPANFTVPFLVWGPGVARGTDLYALNPDRRRDPEEFLVPYNRDQQPIRNAEAGNLALHLLDLSPIPSSIINGLQSLRVSASGDL